MCMCVTEQSTPGKLITVCLLTYTPAPVKPVKLTSSAQFDPKQTGRRIWVGIVHQMCTHTLKRACKRTCIHTNICKHTLILPPEERMFVRKECLSFLLQKTFAPNISVCFPCSNTRVLTSTQAPLGPPTNSMLA